MVKMHPLYSSSSGNMFHFESENSNILIDVGVSYKAIKEGLSSIGKSNEDIDALLITHEHTDHIKGLPLFCRKNPEIPIYATPKTAKYLKEMLDSQNIPSNIIDFKYDKPFKLNDIEITAFETSHDAVMPCGFNLKTDNKLVSYATDLGYVSDDVFCHLKASDFCIIESNYDKTMLEFGKYPYPLKRRIASPTGHLSNEDTAKLLAKLIEVGKAKSNFLLAHLSENNNDAKLATDYITKNLELMGINTKNINLNVASKKLSSEEYNI